MIAQLGVVLYMFLVGLELNPRVLRERAHATVAISHASIIAPFLLGATLALVLYPRLSSGDVPFTSFALFLGVAMSITAFPVLARILTDRRMQRTPLGVLALGCAATDDVTAWCLLAFVVGVDRAEVGAAVPVLVLTAAFIAFMLLVVQPVAARLLARLGEVRLTPGVVALVFTALLLSAITTELIGIHAIFGAFLLGAIIPHDSPVAREFVAKLEDLVTVLLLPAFFAFTGMRTRIGLVSGLEQWLVCGLIILVATVGKFGGTLAAARFTGLGWREAAGLGVLMNTRGLMELIVSEHRAGPRGHLADAVRHDGPDGPGHHDGDDPDVAPAHPAVLSPGSCRAAAERRSVHATTLRVPPRFRPEPWPTVPETVCGIWWPRGHTAVVGWTAEPRRLPGPLPAPAVRPVRGRPQPRHRRSPVGPADHPRWRSPRIAYGPRAGDGAALPPRAVPALSGAWERCLGGTPRNGHRDTLTEAAISSHNFRRVP